MRKFPLHAKYQQKVQSTDTGLGNNNRCHIKLHTVFTRLKAALERIEGILPSTAIKMIPTQTAVISGICVGVDKRQLLLADEIPGNH